MGRTLCMTLLIASMPILPHTKLLGSASAGQTTADSSSESGTGDESVSHDAVVIRDLFEQVAAQRQEIFSAKIKYRWHLASYRRPENTPERVDALLKEHDLLNNPDSLRQIVHTLVPQPATIDPPWEVRTFQMLGEKRRADTSLNKIQLVDGVHEMRYEGKNEQLTIGHRGASNVHLTEITDFRSYPPDSRGGAALQIDDFRLVTQNEHQLVLELAPHPDAAAGALPNRYIIDRETGVLTQALRYRGDQLIQEVRQLALTEYPGGIVIPALRLEMNFQQGRLHALRVFIIEEAEFNGPVAEEEFVMPVAAGTVLVDRRHKEDAVWRTKSAADDVRSLLVPVNTPVAAVSAGGGLSWQTLLILNGVGLIVLATFLWRKSSLSAIPPTNSSRSD